MVDPPEATTNPVLQGVQTAADVAVNAFSHGAEFIASELLFAFSPSEPSGTDHSGYETSPRRGAKPKNHSHKQIAPPQPAHAHTQEKRRSATRLPEPQVTFVPLPKPSPVDEVEEPDEHGLMLDELLSDVGEINRGDDQDMETVSTLSSGAPSKCQAIFRPQPKELPRDASQRYTYLFSENGQREMGLPKAPSLDRNRALVDSNSSQEEEKQLPKTSSMDGRPRLRDIQTREISSPTDELEQVHAWESRMQQQQQQQQQPKKNVTFRPLATRTPPTLQKIPEKQKLADTNPKKPEQERKQRMNKDILELQKALELMEQKPSSKQKSKSSSSSTSKKSAESPASLMFSSSTLDIHTAPTAERSNTTIMPRAPEQGTKRATTTTTDESPNQRRSRELKDLMTRLDRVSARSQMMRGRTQVLPTLLLDNNNTPIPESTSTEEEEEDRSECLSEEAQERLERANRRMEDEHSRQDSEVFEERPSAPSTAGQPLKSYSFLKSMQARLAMLDCQAPLVEPEQVSVTEDNNVLFKETVARLETTKLAAAAAGTSDDNDDDEEKEVSAAASEEDEILRNRRKAYKQHQHQQQPQHQQPQQQQRQDVIDLTAWDDASFFKRGSAMGIPEVQNQ